MLYDMTDGDLREVPRTSFQTEKMLERTHLQAAVRDHIKVLGADLLVIAEEFGDFEAAHRRIDLLCINKAARLVVVELKRTEDGGHMELQALRYSAMISVLTFDDVVATYSKHLRLTDPDIDSDEARTRLMDWIDDFDGDEPVVPRQVSIVLAAADFGQEVTTTVLWLNEFYGLDITCVRLAPYRIDGKLLLDVQQVIPLPEAEALTVKIKKREAAVKKASESEKDFTKFVIRGPKGVTAPLSKRHAILQMVHQVHALGVPCDEIKKVLPASKFRAVPGEVDVKDLWDAMVGELELKPDQDHRWHLHRPVVENGTTWVLHSNWGPPTQKCLEELSRLSQRQVVAEAQPQP